MMRVGVLGMAGRMGRLLLEEARSAGHEVVGGTLNPASDRMPPGGLSVLPLPDLLATADAVLDFRHASAVVAHAAALSRGRAAWIVGTTGLSAEQEAALSDAARHVPVTYAAHFGLGINLLAGRPSSGRCSAA